MNDAAKNKITYTHDYFVRTAMSDMRIAREFFVAHLPSQILHAIDLTNLSLQPRSYINELRKESIVDLLYKTTMADRDAFIYLLLEHQSRPDEMMAFRILKYTCNILDHHIKASPGTLLPMIYPMVIYHGEHPYPYTTNINDIVDAPRDVVNNYFLKPFQLIDLGRIEDAELKKHAWAGVMEFVLKHIYARDIMPYIKDIAEILRRIAESGGADYVSIVLQYVLERAELKDKDTFITLINSQISLKVGDNIMTLAEQLRLEGRQEQQIEIARRMLIERAEPAFIARITELPLNTILDLQVN